jgi:hypothetical protein
VRGGSTVSLVEPLGRSRGGCRLLLTGFVVDVGGLSPGTNETPGDKLTTLQRSGSLRTATTGCILVEPAHGHGDPRAQIFLGAIHHAAVEA